MDQKRFEEAKKKIIGVDRQRLGIGTLSEKTVHAIFKDYCEPDEDHQEIPIENYVLIMMDLNGLKAANDNIGHEAGDELIIGAERRCSV